MSSLSVPRSWLELPIVDTRSSELTFPASPGGCLHVNANQIRLDPKLASFPPQITWPARPLQGA